MSTTYSSDQSNSGYLDFFAQLCYIRPKPHTCGPRRETHVNVQQLKDLPANRRIILSIDTPDLDAGIALATQLKDLIWGVKIGYIPFLDRGKAAIKRFKDHGINVMADPKLHDIPNTVRGATAICREAGADFITMHASMGAEGMKAVTQECGDSMLSLAVTVLTSMFEDDCYAIYGDESKVVISQLAQFAMDEDHAHGIVCSPNDLGILRDELENFDDTLFVTPGVRPAGSNADDQARVATPGQAILDGATLLVIGRAITMADDPQETTKAIVEEIEYALQSLDTPENQE